MGTGKNSNKVIAKHVIITLQGPRVADNYPFDCFVLPFLEVRMSLWYPRVKALIQNYISCCQISGSIDLDSMVCHFSAYLILPWILPKIPIGSTTGDLNNDIKLPINLTVASGFLRLYISEKVLHCQVNLKSIFGDSDVDLIMFKIP
jgi:hypothetical protein